MDQRGADAHPGPPETHREAHQIRLEDDFQHIKDGIDALTGIATEADDQTAGAGAVVFMAERLQELAAAFTERLEAGRAKP